MATGTVKWFNPGKGFGFISPDDGSGDIFAHYTGIAGNGFRSLEENQKVQYEVGQGAKGPVTAEHPRAVTLNDSIGAAKRVPWPELKGRDRRRAGVEPCALGDAVGLLGRGPDFRLRQSGFNPYRTAAIALEM